MNSLTNLMESLHLPETPYTATGFDRQKQIAQHVDYLNRFEQEDLTKFQRLALFAVCTAPNASLPVVPIIGDNVITISDIINAGPDVVHRGKILLCRSILPTYKLGALILLVDDPDGKFVLRTPLNNFSKSVRVGTILAIMHPWLSRASNGSMAIRCENPMHVYLVKPTDLILQNVIWKAELPIESGIEKNAAIESKSDDEDPINQGNRCYVEKNYSKALECFTKAIELDPNNPVSFSNRALTYLALEKPLQALADTETGLALDEFHLKLVYRKAKALLMLKRYREAFDFVSETTQQVKVEMAKNREFKKLIKNTVVMLGEFEHGIYNLDQMEEEAKQCKILENHADYSAPMFEIKEIAGKGRGLVATRDIPANTLIMGSKAFAFTIGTEDQLHFATSLGLENAASIGYASLVRQVCDKLMTNPQLGEEFYQLYAGADLGVLHEYDESNPVDIDRIWAILRMNSFGFTKDHSWGLWLRQSYFNHSCGDFNCDWRGIGDFMFVSTNKRIKEGDELLISYQLNTPYEERSQALEKHWGFTCGCTLCVADRLHLGSG